MFSAVFSNRARSSSVAEGCIKKAARIFATTAGLRASRENIDLGIDQYNSDSNICARRTDLRSSRSTLRYALVETVIKERRPCAEPA